MKILGQEGLNFIANKYKELKESLSEYAKKSEVGSKIDKSQISNNLQETGSDKVASAYALSMVYDMLSKHKNIYTDQEKDKLNSIEQGANKTTKLSQLTDDSTHRLVTDTEKTKWNNKLDSLIGKDVSRSKTEGYESATAWQSVHSSRDVENWIGDFDKRTRENKESVRYFTQDSAKLPDLKYRTLKTLKPGFYQVSSEGDIADNGETLDCDGYGYLLLTPEINGSLFVGFDFFYPGFWVGIKDDDKKEVFWAPIINCVGGKNANERLSQIKEQVILTQSQYNALSSSEKNDESKIYFIKG